MQRQEAGCEATQLKSMKEGDYIVVCAARQTYEATHDGGGKKRGAVRIGLALAAPPMQAQVQLQGVDSCAVRNAA